ncbi:kinesin-like protein KIN-7M, chloroplastic [Gossypium hirsutum]|uniref:Kinesin-like protein KIN-7M, chloroplastic n=1 Tax=Gossypium hirsutum TaxID=3635 RepID=A0A1U8PXT6_GOSHI|nr:kinesin-like protein KIN-7M, chloroplastic [Gossypium hirsutum]
MGHIERFCKELRNQQQVGAHVVVKEEEDHLFVVSCFSSSILYDGWLVDSGCSNHMTYDEKLFKDLDRSLKSKVRIGNGEYLEVNERGTVVIESCAGTKLISDVLFVPEIDQNLLSVSQLVEKSVTPHNRIVQEQLQIKCFENEELHAKVTLLEQQLTYLSDKLSSFVDEISEEHAMSHGKRIYLRRSRMALHARKLLEATLEVEATLVKKEFIEGEY